MKNLFKEYDSVFATRNINERVTKGTMGCIMLVYNTENFEVEFFVNNTLDSYIRNSAQNGKSFDRLYKSEFGNNDEVLDFQTSRDNGFTKDSEKILIRAFDFDN